MLSSNPYRPPDDHDSHLSRKRCVRSAVVAVVLLSVVLSAFKIARNLSGVSEAPDGTPVLVGVVLFLWIAWMVIELLAARLVWRGHVAGRWILVASFGLKGIGQAASLLSAWPLIARGPTIAIYPPYVFYAAQSFLYFGLVIWLLVAFPLRRRTQVP